MSNALDISIPVTKIAVSCICVLTMIHLRARMISVVLLLFLYELFDWARLVLSSVLFIKILDRIFLITSGSVIDRSSFQWFLGLFWFWEG